jgi:hypothetical protein
MCLVVSKCLFSNLGLPETGGAILLQYSESAYYSEIKSTTFVACRVSSSGGAVHATVKNLIFQKCCICDCSSRRSGQAIFVDVSNEPDDGFLNFTQITIFYCGLDGSDDAEFGAIEVDRGKPPISETNFTRCRVSGSGAAIYHPLIGEAGCAIWERSVITNCSGTSIWYFDRQSDVQTIANCGFYENKASEALIYLKHQLEFEVRECRFEGSEVVFRTEAVSGTLFVKCWFENGFPSNCTVEEGGIGKTAKYSYRGIDSEYCPLTGTVQLGPRKTGKPTESVVMSATEKFTNPWKIVRVRNIWLGMFVVPMELNW